jgi:hypothetical protein
MCNVEHNMYVREYKPFLLIHTEILFIRLSECFSSFCRSILLLQMKTICMFEENISASKFFLQASAINVQAKWLLEFGLEMYR